MTLDLLPGLQGYELVLASGSPRRRELLAMLDVPFTLARMPHIDEVWPANLPLRDIPRYLACFKADACRSLIGPGQVWITADTVVISPDGELMGKPRDEADARRMLRSLSGRTHEVVTGVAITSAGKQTSFEASTRVDFASIPVAEIDSYVARYKPMDKAGAYGIQEWIGAVGIKSIDGSFYNVMGLPVHRLWEALKAFRP